MWRIEAAFHQWRWKHFCPTYVMYLQIFNIIIKQGGESFVLFPNRQREFNSSRNRQKEQETFPHAVYINVNIFFCFNYAFNSGAYESQLYPSAVQKDKCSVK